MKYKDSGVDVGEPFRAVELMKNMSIKPRLRMQSEVSAVLADSMLWMSKT